GRLQSEVQPGIARGDPAPCSAHHVSLLDEVGLEDVLDGAAFLAQRSGEALDTDRAAVELVDDRQQQAPVHRIEAAGVDLQQVHRLAGNLRGDHTVRLYLGE